MLAEGWIKSIEVIFAFMEFQEADRVRCATFLLTGDARLWWESASVAANLHTLSWDGFKEIFYSKYFTEEGDSNVAEFVRKFERGCHFVPLIANDAQSKLRYFMDGLQPVLRRDVRVAGPTTYTIAVSRALTTEQDQRDIEADRQGKRPYQAPQQQQEQRPQFKRPFQGQPGKRPYQGPPKAKGPMPHQKAPQRPREHPVCPKCNRQHPGQCLYGSGNIFTKRLSTKDMIDSGATHSFISETFASHLDVKYIGLDASYSVTVPSREELLATSMIRDIEKELQGHLVYADLIVLPMPEFDIILMEWLTKNRVFIEFQKRSVLAWRLISKGCQAFLASIISIPDVPTPSIYEVPVVREFPDVFPDDIAGLPPERGGVCD
ncbi:uncharacterized protein [Primulina eburnea]|uniref:uncharacterized protein n=1 Tax=Primulina eburnea TaxID=1245227 RepID=UPI003C6BF1C8